MFNVKNEFSATMKVALIAVGMMMATSCNSTQPVNEETNEDQQAMQVEQVQPQVHRTAFIPTEGTPDFVTAAEKSLNAVVHIKTKIEKQTTTYNDFFGALLQQFYGMPGQAQKQYLEAYGSGVVLSPDGYIVTNNHVVEGAAELTVTFNDKKERKATIVGTDPSTDLALIKVDAQDLEYLVFGDSDKVRVGEWVLAVGNPFRLNSTVTAGIVSAKARDLSILGEGTNVDTFIQTDAAINPGNSGGALVNTNGELIGINAAIASHTGSYEGYSFAIPSNIVRKVVDDLLMYGETQRAYLGIQMAEITAELADKFGLDEMQGVYVAEVTNGGAAAQAGIKKGDVITAINGNKVNTGAQLLENIRQFRPGDKVNVEVRRNGSQHNYEITLLNEMGSLNLVKKGESFYASDLGLMLQPVNQEDKAKLNIKNGLKIVEIRQGRFYGSGINEGFVITAVNGQNVNSKADLEKTLKNNRSSRVRMEGVYPNGMKVNFEYYE